MNSPPSDASAAAAAAAAARLAHQNAVEVRHDLLGCEATPKPDAGPQGWVAERRHQLGRARESLVEVLKKDHGVADPVACVVEGGHQSPRGARHELRIPLPLLLVLLCAPGAGAEYGSTSFHW